jgi:hypothetical protein
VVASFEVFSAHLGILCGSAVDLCGKKFHHRDAKVAEVRGAEIRASTRIDRPVDKQLLNE